MVTAIIGQQFLAQYNQEHGDDLSARAFFETKFLSLFYSHPKYMMVGGNTALSNPPFRKGTLPTSEERAKRMTTLLANIEAGYLDTRTTLDFPSVEPVAGKGDFNTTSGQTTDLKIAYDPDTAFYSWIGNGLSVGIGGVTVLFDHPLILNAIFLGWSHYRDYLNDQAYEELPGRKIHAWNATWLNHYFSGQRLRDFSPVSSDKKGNMTVKAGFWGNPLFSIAQKLSGERLMGYVFQASNLNQTYGFIPFDLPDVKRLPELYKYLFGNYADQRDTQEVETLYGNNQAFLLACQRGAIGVSAFEPAGLWQFAYPDTAKVKKGKTPKKENGWREYNPNNSTERFTFNTYQTWLLAMLKRSDYWDAANKAADLLRAYENKAAKARTDRANQIIKILATKTQLAFLDELSTVLKAIDLESVEALTEIAKEVHELSPDGFVYFRTLIKLRYIRQVRLENKEPIN